MEASIINEIINGNTAVMAVLFLFLFKAHKEAMAKLDRLTETMSELVNSNTAHAKELEFGTKEFEKIEKHQDKQDRKIESMDKTLHELQNKMLTQEHLKVLLEK